MISPPRAHGHRIVIEKAHRTLHLYAGLHIERSYPVALGRNWAVDKAVEGDEAMPVGHGRVAGSALVSLASWMGGWGSWGAEPDEQFVTHYTGHVLANLAGPGGKGMPRLRDAAFIISRITTGIREPAHRASWMNHPGVPFCLPPMR